MMDVDSVERLRSDMKHDVTFLACELEKHKKEIRNLKLALEVIYKATKDEEKLEQDTGVRLYG